MNAPVDGGRLLWQGADWDFATLERIHDACAQVATGDTN